MKSQERHREVVDQIALMHECSIDAYECLVHAITEIMPTTNDTDYAVLVAALEDASMMLAYSAPTAPKGRR